MRTIACSACLPIFSLLLACAAPPIAAAGFDCGKAANRFEKTVCADPTLSAQDAAMAQRYDAALALLSAPGKNILRSGQRQWRAAVRILCIDNRRDERPAACLQRQYAARLDDLRSAAVAVGPFLFSRSDRYAAAGTQMSTGLPLEQHAGLPRIDRPQSAQAQRWNAAIARSAAAARANWCFGDDATPAEQSLGFRIRSATSDLINVQMMHYERCDEGAGAEDTRNISYLLKPDLHPLAAADLFRPGSRWEAYLGARAARNVNPDGDAMFAESIERGVRDPAAWSFTERELIISFNPGEAAAIASGILEVRVPWADLQRFLAPGAPLPR
jgi:uncharacterized protein